MTITQLSEKGLETSLKLSLCWICALKDVAARDTSCDSCIPNEPKLHGEKPKLCQPLRSENIQNKISTGLQDAPH